MDFLENLFHIAPDNGSGLTEIALFAVLAVAPLLLALRLKTKRQHR